MIATGSLRATWLPEGLNKSFECTFILKNKLWNSCFVSFDYNLMFFSLFSDSAAFLFHLFHLIGESNSWILKIAGVSFDKWRFKVFYGVSIVLKDFLGCWRASCIAMKVRSKLTPHQITRHLLTHICFVLINNFSLLPILFDRSSRWESSSIISSSLFYSVKCW